MIIWGDNEACDSPGPCASPCPCANPCHGLSDATRGEGDEDDDNDDDNKNDDIGEED